MQYQDDQRDDVERVEHSPLSLTAAPTNREPGRRARHDTDDSSDIAAHNKGAVANA
jgi:hypothetical protein